MQNIKPLFKRVSAYVIDLFIVLLISSAISSIPAINKNMDDYQQTYKEYEKEYNNYAEYFTLLQESYEDEEITSKEYTELTKNETYKELIISKYEDESISKDEYKEIITEINKEFDLVANDYIYLLNKKGVSNSIITLVCTLFYFGVIQYIFRGQTIGKRLFKLKVVSASDKKINILNYLLRTLLINDVLLNTVSIIFLLAASKTIYNQANTIIGALISILEAIVIFLVLTREDKRGLHDLLFNTKVISTDIVETNEETEYSKEQEEVQTTKNVKKHPNSKSKTKSKKKIIDAEYKEEK